MISDIKAVLFDYGGTLDSDGLHWQERFYSLYEEEGLFVDRDAFAAAFYDSDDNLPKRFDLKGLDLESTVRLQVGCVLDYLKLDKTPHQESITRKFSGRSDENVKKIRPFLERLSCKYALGVVSNFYGNLESILKAQGILSFFGAVADSENVGATKPDSALFLHTTHALGVEPQNALMVGDNLRRDMAGAESLDMPHAWIDGGRPHLSPCCKNVLRVSTLLELEKMLLSKENAL